jgi:hypothetical protein
MPLFSDSSLLLSKVLMVAVLCSSELHRLLGAAEHLLALGVEQAIGIAHQRGGLLQRDTACLPTCASCLSASGRYRPRWPAMALVVCSRLFRVLLTRSTFSWENSRLALCSSMLTLAITSEPSVSRRAIGEGEATISGNLPSLPLSGGLLRVAAAELDDRGAGHTGQRQLGLGVDLDRGIGRPGGCAPAPGAGPCRPAAGSITSPTLIPLYCTELPLDRPLTASLNTTS